MKAQLELLENVLGLCLLKTRRCLESLFLAHLYCSGTNDPPGELFLPHSVLFPLTDHQQLITLSEPQFPHLLESK